jgi:ATP-dependent Lon protease
VLLVGPPGTGKTTVAEGDCRGGRRAHVRCAIHRSELRGRCATLTPHWHKTSGNP